MANKDPNRKLGKKDKATGMTTAQLYIEKLTLPGLRRECLIRGMEFQAVTDASVLNLQSWFLKNFPNPIHTEKLNEYDVWIETELRARGVDECFLDPVFRLGYINEQDADGNVTKRKRVSVISSPKKRREKTTDGLFTGTKKAYTFLLQSQGKTKAETTQLVIETFPDAKEKSISIWFNKSKKKRGAK